MKRPRLSTSKATGAKKDPDKYSKVFWTSTESPEPMTRHFFSGQPGVPTLLKVVNS